MGSPLRKQPTTHRCGHRGCTTTLELPPGTAGRTTQQMVRLAGWCWRGTQTGYAYYCAAHRPPSN